MEQKTCNYEEGLFEILNKKFKSQYNETMKLLQFCILVRQHNKSMEELMGRLRTAAMEYNHNKVDRHLKQFIHELNDQEKLKEIIREVTKSDENLMIPTEHVLIWIKSSKSTGGGN